MPRSPFVVVLALVLLPAAGCDAVGGSLVEFRNAALLSPPVGFTETDALGAVLTTDPADWRTAPLYGPASDVRVSVTQPPYPNPAAREAGVVLGVNVQGGPVPGGLALRGFTRDGRLVPLDPLAGALEAGIGFVFLTFRADALLGPGETGGLRRVILFDGRGEPVTYGDLLVE